MKWRVTYNLHRYSDNSDIPTKGGRLVEADTEEDAWDAMVAIRTRVNETDRGGYGMSRRRYIGMIDNYIEVA